MKKFKVVLEFIYDKGELISEWNIDPLGFDYVETPEQAIEVAIAEVEANGINNFTLEVFDENGEFLKSN